MTTQSATSSQTNNPSISLGPDKLTVQANPADDKTQRPTPSFILSRGEWLTIQLYVANALQLPADAESMRKVLKTGEDEPMEEFSPLFSQYKLVKQHCTIWRDETYPNVVKIASNIFHYGTNVPAAYDAISKLIPLLKKKPSDEVKQDFKELVEDLLAQAQTYAQQAQEVEKAVSDFADLTEKDKEALDTLNATYDKKFGDKGNLNTRLRADLAKQHKILKEKTEEYNHYVVVAATTPTYAWLNFPPFPPLVGLITASVVAGVYGDRAVKAKQAMDAALAQIKTMGEQLSGNAAIMALLGYAGDQLDELRLQITAALPVIRKIRDGWSSIAGDLASLTTLIDEDIAQAQPILMQLGVNKAVEQWAQIAALADQYRENAFITIQPAPAA